MTDNANPIDVDMLVSTMQAFKVQRDRAELAFRRAQQLLLDHMEQTGQKSVTTKTGRKATVVEGESTSWNEPVLRDLLGPLWNEVTKEVLDPAKLEHVIERDQIPEASLKDALVTTKKAAYIRVTEPKSSGS